MEKRGIGSMTGGRTSGILLFTLLLAWPALGGGFAGGTGEPDDPYQIATAQQLTSIGSDPNDLAKCFVLVADIDLDPNLPGNRVFDRAVIAPDTNDTKPEFQGPAFTGVFDGNGRVISNLSVNGSASLGLFGRLDSGGQIMALGLEGVNIVGTGDMVGGFAGRNASGTISACYSTGSVSGVTYVGGLVGYSDDGTISGCHSASSIKGRNYVGGLLGYNFGVIFACYSSGSVSGDNNVGGLVGYHLSGVISACYSTGTVSGKKMVAGLVGANFASGTISACYSMGRVSGNNDVAGLVGYNSSGTVSACYSMGRVSGTYDVGGLVGRNEYGAISACFWDTQTSGRTTSAGGTGLTTSEMQAISTFINAGWDFVGERPNGLCEYWQMPMGGGYPVLSIFSGFAPHALQGTGTADDPYLLETAEDLGAVWYRPTASYRLAADIDLSGITWGMAVISAFSGRWDGQSHRIVGLNMAGGGYLGLFGCLTRGAAVFDLGLENVNVVGTGNLAGGLVAINRGAVFGCNSSGSVSAKQEVGGLVGQNDDTILACYSMGRVSGDKDVGGLVGYNEYGSMSACYSTSSVGGKQEVGGLVGRNDDMISACYSMGRVSGNKDIGGLVGVDYGTITACFWDTQTSGRTTSAGGTGLTTSEMQAISTFINAGWDFVGERPNGLCEYWQMPMGAGYPVLSIFNGFVPRALQGTGTADDPYLLETAEDLGAVWYRPMASYQLAADMDFSGITWGMAVIPAFSGRWDGQDHRIVGLNIIGGEYLGLIGCLAQGAAVFDLGLENVNIVGKGDRVGGLVGYSYRGTVSACHSSGSVGGRAGVGGLVGSNSGFISDCCSTGSVSSEWDAGGLVGNNSGPISACYSTGPVSGTYNIGGLVGSNSAFIAACYSTGRVSGDTRVGGLVGNNVYGVISTCHYAGRVTGDENVGGLVGNSQGRVSACYNTGSVSGYKKVGGLVGYHPSGMISDCYSTGWIGSNLSWSSSVGGLVGENAGTISACCSTGSVGGGSYVGGDYVGGLVGSNKPGGTISACYSRGSISGRASIGGLAGYNGSAIWACYSSASASGTASNVGGLVGFNENLGTISTSYSMGSARGSNDVGGLVGLNRNGAISACYSTGSVSSDNGVGGLMGHNSGGRISVCFWDTDTSGRTISEGGTGLPTSRMQTIDTFLNAAWDFVGTWCMPAGDYPHLLWEDRCERESEGN